MSGALPADMLQEVRRIRAGLEVQRELERQAKERDHIRAIRDQARDAEIASLYRSYRADVEPVPDPITGKFVYAEVSEYTIDPEVRRVAAFAVAWATMDNGLRRLPKCSWMVPETDADRSHVARWGRRDWAWIAARRPASGLAVRDEGHIWLSAALSLRDVVAIATHEVRHVAQPMDMADSEIEPDAYEYSARVERTVRHAYDLVH